MRNPMLAIPRGDSIEPDWSIVLSRRPSGLWRKSVGRDEKSAVKYFMSEHTIWFTDIAAIFQVPLGRIYRERKLVLPIQPELENVCLRTSYLV